MPCKRPQTDHSAAKWLRRTIPQSRASDPVLAGICASLGEQLGGNPYVELRSASRAYDGRIELIRTYNMRDGRPRGLFHCASDNWKPSLTFSSYGKTIHPRPVYLKKGSRLWDMYHDGVLLTTAGLNPRTGEQWDEGGCAIHSIWCAVHEGAKSYRTIRTLLGIIDNLSRGTLRRDVGEKGVYPSTINKYIGHYGLRLDTVHRDYNVSVDDRRRALETIYRYNRNCIMILRVDDESWHVVAVHNGIPVGHSVRDVYRAEDFESIDSVSIPIWGGGR